MLAEARGFSVQRSGDAPLSAAQTTGPPTPSQASSSSHVTEDAAIPSATAASKKNKTRAKAADKIEDPDDSGDEGQDQQLHQLVLGVAKKNNVKFSRSGMLPWNTFARECYNGGIQIQNYPRGVTLPWNMPEDKKLRKKGVRNLSKGDQAKLAAACAPQAEHPLKFQTFTPAEIQACIRPIAILAPDSDGHRVEIFADKIDELAKKKPIIKTEVNDSAMAVDEPDELAGTRKSSRSTTRSVRFGTADPQDEEIDELAEGLMSDDDPFGILSTQDDDDGDYGSPQKHKRKRVKKATDKGKGRMVGSTPTTPTTPTPMTARRVQDDTTPKAPKRKPPPESEATSAKRPKAEQSASATEPQPQGFTLFGRIAENARKAPTSAQRIPAVDFGFQPVLSSISSARTHEPPSRNASIASTSTPSAPPIATAPTREPPSRSTSAASNSASTPTAPSTPTTARAGFGAARPRRVQVQDGGRAATAPRTEPPITMIQQQQQLPVAPEATIGLPPPNPAAAPAQSHPVANLAGPSHSAYPHPAPTAVAPLQQADMLQLLQNLQNVNPLLLQHFLVALQTTQGAGAGGFGTGGPGSSNSFQSYAVGAQKFDRLEGVTNPGSLTEDLLPNDAAFTLHSPL
ncbi:hypothetical protein PM082_021146 [Marasmius tenuissimus]|nr:hypothetical protein PM082_021146 [Marasmius tenuissimus]